jgi:hypothetical protein
MSLELLASFKSLDSEGALAPDLLDAICQQAQRSWERINISRASRSSRFDGFFGFDKRQVSVVDVGGRQLA